MQDNGLNFVKLHDLIDVDKNNSINRREFQNFFGKKMNIELDPEELNIFIKYCDKN